MVAGGAVSADLMPGTQMQAPTDFAADFVLRENLIAVPDLQFGTRRHQQGPVVGGQ